MALIDTGESVVSSASCAIEQASLEQLSTPSAAADRSLLADISYVPFIMRIREVLPHAIQDFAVSYHGDVLVVHIKHGRDLDRRTLHELRKDLDALSIPELKVVFTFAPLRPRAGEETDMEPTETPSMSGIGAAHKSRAAVDTVIRDSAPEGVEVRRISRYKTEFGRGTYQFAWVKAFVPSDVDYGALREWSTHVEKSCGVGLLIAREPSFAQLNLNHRRLVEEDGLIRDPLKVERRLRVINGAPPPENGSVPRAPERRTGIRDLTYLNFVTIDSNGTGARDDALFAETFSDGTVRAIVAFVDVTERVPAGSAVDRYAKRAGFTLYGRNRALSMLPDKLAYDELSLNLGCERQVFAMELYVSAAGEVIKRDFFRGKIAVKDQFTFQSVGERISELNSVSQDVLQSLWIGAHALRSGRAPKVSFMSIEQGGVWDTVVHEWMIAAKHHVADTMAEAGVPILYRVYSPPGRSVRKLFMRRALAVDVDVKMADFVRPERFQELLRRIQDAGHKHLYFDILDTYLRRARYDVQNIGHHGLGFEAYTEIKGLRTYAGVINQRQAACALSAEPKAEFTELKRVQSHVNRKARVRDDNIYRLLVLEELHEKLLSVGQTFSAALHASSDGSLRVEVAGFDKHGLIRDKDLKESDLTAGSVMPVKLSGFDPVSRRYVFSLV